MDQSLRTMNLNNPLIDTGTKEIKMKEKSITEFFKNRLGEARRIFEELEKNQIPIMEKMVEILKKVRRRRGRVFFCGVGGGAGNGTHATGDFFKSCRIRTICLTDNIPLLTATTNDEGWHKIFVEPLETWGFGSNDVLFVLSVGGGDAERDISRNIVEAVSFAKGRGGRVLGIVGKADGYTARNGDAVIVVSAVNPDYRTAHTESIQAYITHLLTEALRQRSAKWESVTISPPA
ncbi:MAG: SIS domain-containing protein [Patescibacteria group bacterium]|nr:SIS domain-containing protein [Patescibacteria group bacterium]